MSLPVIHKVVAYITRERGGQAEILVFEHRDYPEAGLQVPAGTVEPGEDIERALSREVWEETGLSELNIRKKLGVFDYRHPNTLRIHVRHVFHLQAPEETAERWEWTETSGGRAPENEMYVFCFGWRSLSEKLELAGRLGDYLHLL